MIKTLFPGMNSWGTFLNTMQGVRTAAFSMTREHMTPGQGADILTFPVRAPSHTPPPTPVANSITTRVAPLALERPGTDANILRAYFQAHGLEHTATGDVKRMVGLTNPAQAVHFESTGLSAIHLFLSAEDLRTHLFQTASTFPLLEAFAPENNPLQHLVLQRFAGIIERLPSDLDEFLYSTLNLPQKLQVDLRFDSKGKLLGAITFLADWLDIQHMVAHNAVVNGDEALTTILELDDVYSSHRARANDHDSRYSFSEDTMKMGGDLFIGSTLKSSTSRYIWYYHDRKEQRLVRVIFRNVIGDPLHVNIWFYDLDEKSDFPKSSSTNQELAREKVLNFYLPVIDVVGKEDHSGPTALEAAIRRAAAKNDPPIILAQDEGEPPICDCEHDFLALAFEAMAKTDVRAHWYAGLALESVLAQFKANDETSFAGLIEGE